MKLIFIVLSVLLFISLLTGNLYFYKHPNRFVRERSVTIGAFLMTFYSLFCIILMFFATVLAKPILVFCGFSPFIIGRYTTYKRLLFFTIMQLLVIVSGIIYAFGNKMV